MAQRKLIVANWKMNKGLVQSQKFADELVKYVSKNKNINCEIVLCPPFTSLEAVHRKIKDTSIKLGGQNVNEGVAGPFTGEVSCGMLKSCGCEYVIVGHSERRNYFSESNELINKKVLRVLDEGLKVILCIGETLQEHQDNLTDAIIEEQLKTCLNHVTGELILNVVIAYEPVWAIGTGKNATLHQAESVHNFIRKKLKKSYNEKIAAKIRIIYGGSITQDNSKELFAPETINGGLVGGASLDEKSFIQIINSSL